MNIKHLINNFLFLFFSISFIFHKAKRKYFFLFYTIFNFYLNNLVGFIGIEKIKFSYINFYFCLIKQNKFKKLFLKNKIK